MYIKTISTYVEVIMIQVIHNKPQTKVETNKDLFTKKSIFLFSNILYTKQILYTEENNK